MIVDTVICGEVALAVLAGLTAGGVVAANPDSRSAAQDVANGVATTVSNAITNVRTNMPRGWAYVTSGDWRPDHELFPLSAQEGKSVRLGPNLDELCPSGPGGFSLEQLDPYWWIRPGPDLGGEAPLRHTGAPMVGEPPTVVLAADWSVGDPIDQVDILSGN